MCIWFMEGEEHPMIKISKVIFDYVKVNGSNEDGLKDHLAILNDEGVIKGCACDGIFSIREIDGGYEVFLEPMSGNVYKVTIVGNTYQYDVSYPAEAIDDYDEITYNEYKEDE